MNISYLCVANDFSCSKMHARFADLADGESRHNQVLMPWPSTYDQRRYVALKGALFVLALVILYVWGNSMMGGPRPRGMFGLHWNEMWILPLMMGIYLIPFVTVVLVAIAALKYLRTSSRGKQ